jgi:ribonuclease BN (tRNA processing enzyme)
VNLTIVGCSPAWPNPGGAQSGYLVEDDGRRLLLDCGAGVLARLREREEWPRVDAIAITHFHLDHWADLVPWVWGALFGPGRDVPTVELWLPPAGIRQLQHMGTHFGREEMFEQAFALREYAGGEPFTAAGFEVTAARLVHYDLETYGFRVAGNGATLTYSGDSAPCGELVELARDADLFLCEATLATGALEGDLRGHLSADEALAAFRDAGASRLLITHRPYELPLEPGLEQAHDGLELEIAPVGAA